MKNSNYNNLFKKPFDNAQAIDKKVMNLVFNQESKELLNYLREQECNCFYLDDFMIMQAIHKFTLKDTDENELEDYINCIRNQEDVYSVKIIKDEIYETYKMKIKRENNIIEVIPFSKLVPGILKCMPKLENMNRVGECFDMSISIAKKLKVKCNIVTGYIYGTTDKSRILHSWIETKLDEKEVVIDSVFNAIFNKEGYYSLTKAEKKQIISSEDHIEDIRNYLTHLNGCVDTLPLETYLYFRDEIMKDLKNNESIYSNYRK